MPSMTGAYPTYLLTTWTSSVPLTVTFTPATGELLVIKVVTEDVTNATPQAPTVTGGGNPAVTPGVSDATTGNSWAGIWKTAAVTSATSTTVSCLKSGTGNYSAGMVVERWASAVFAGTPATCDTRGSGAAPGGVPSTTITTAAAGSAVTWCNGDWSAIDGTTRAYDTASATPAETGYVYASGKYTAYWAYQDAPSAAQQTLGITTPAGQTWKLVGIEIQSAATNATVPMAGFLAAASTRPAPQLMSVAGPAWAGSAADLGGGAGSWSGAGSAAGAPDSTYATWAVT